MKYLINIIKILLIIIILTFIFGTLSYFNIINDQISSTIILTCFFISLFIICYNLGRKKEKNGYIEGIMFGTFISLLFFVIRIIFRLKITKVKLLYYLFIIIISTIGSVLGINKKTKV